MKDKKPYVGAAMFYDRFTDEETVARAAMFLTTDGVLRQEVPDLRDEVDDRPPAGGLASRMLRAVLAGRSVQKPSE